MGKKIALYIPVNHSNMVTMWWDKKKNGHGIWLSFTFILFIYLLSI